MKIRGRFLWLALVAVISLVGLIVAIPLFGISGDFLKSSLVVWVTLLITGVVVCLYPHIFNIQTFRLPGIFLAFYSLMILLPLPFVYVDYPHFTRNTFLFGTTISFLFTLAGIILMHYWVPSSAKSVQCWLSKTIRAPRNLQIASLVLLVICMTLFLLYIKQVGPLPIVEAISRSKDTSQLVLAREYALKLIPGGIRYVYIVLRDVVFPYTTLLLLSVATRLRGRGWKIIFLVSLLASLVYAGATLEKSPVAAIVIMLAYTWLLLQGRTLSIKILLIIMLAALAFPAFVFFALYQFNIDAASVITAIVVRVFYSPPLSILYYIDYFPKHKDFLLGHTLPYLNKLITDVPFPVANAICLYEDPTTFFSCTSNVAYPGYFWADFGWVGIVIGSLICGIWLQGIQVLILRLPKSAPTVVLQSMLSYQVIMLTSTSFLDFLDPLGTGFEIVLTLLLLPTVVRVRMNLAASESKILNS